MDLRGRKETRLCRYFSVAQDYETSIAHLVQSPSSSKEEAGGLPQGHTAGWSSQNLNVLSSVKSS